MSAASSLASLLSAASLALGAAPAWGGAHAGDPAPQAAVPAELPRTAEPSKLTIKNVEAEDAPIDLNSASVEVLRELPGIGRRRAEAIVALRARRPFSRVSQLLLVKGIGSKTLARLKPRLVVRPVSAPPTQASAAARPAG